jgi:hypothetical protein
LYGSNRCSNCIGLRLCPLTILQHLRPVSANMRTERAGRVNAQVNPGCAEAENDERLHLDCQHSTADTWSTHNYQSKGNPGQSRAQLDGIAHCEMYHYRCIGRQRKRRGQVQFEWKAPVTKYTYPHYHGTCSIQSYRFRHKLKVLFNRKMGKTR